MNDLALKGFPDRDLHTNDSIRRYFFISFVSLHIYFSILETLKEKKLSQKIYVKDAFLD